MKGTIDKTLYMKLTFIIRILNKFKKLILEFAVKYKNKNKFIDHSMIYLSGSRQI